MKILFYGAGVLGSLYAARLQEAGQDVSILARGQRLTAIRDQGIVLEDGDTGQQTSVPINAVEKLDPTDAYDLVVVLMPKQYISEILPILAANQHTPNILFMFNNASGPEELINALGRERILLGFAGAGGTRKDHVIRYRVVDGEKQSTTLGELDGSTTPRLERIASVFESAGFPVVISPQMDAWLKSHAALVGPMAHALYLVGGDNYRLAENKKVIALMLRAIRESVLVLQELDIPVIPPRLNSVRWIPMPVLAALMRRSFQSPEMADLVGHALAARAEMEQIASEFTALARTTSVRTPAMDQLFGLTASK